VWYLNQIQEKQLAIGSVMGKVQMFKIKLSLFVSIFLLFISAQTFAQQPTPTPDCATELQTVKTRLTNAENRLADWAQLKRYADANTKVQPPQKNETRVVFLGDSITDNWSRDGFGGFFPGKPYINRGISGQTTPQMLIRFRPDVIALKPQVVVILAGTNDISGNTGPMTLEAIENNLMSIAELATANKIKVVFASVLPVSDYNKRSNGEQIIRTVQRPPEKILELNKWLKEYAANNGYTYLDYFSALVDDKGFLKADIANDGLHPNAKGYAIMSPLAEEAIKKALKSKR
jgi:lysophospholipase L1-like esterase